PHIAPTAVEGVVILLPPCGRGERANPPNTTSTQERLASPTAARHTPRDSGGIAMHIKFAALLAGALLSAGIAAAKPCAKPADVTAFDVAGLKSKLMVTALTCNQQDRYNDFVQRFRSELVAHERA